MKSRSRFICLVLLLMLLIPVTAQANRGWVSCTQSPTGQYTDVSGTYIVRSTPLEACQDCMTSESWKQYMYVVPFTNSTEPNAPIISYVCWISSDNPQYANDTALFNIFPVCSDTESFNFTTGACNPFATGTLPKATADQQKELACSVKSDPKKSIFNPCNAATGNKFQTETDFNSHSTGLTFTRSYNSLHQQDRVLGFGWTGPNDKRLELYNNGDLIQVREANGRGYPFTKQTDGTWKADGDETATLTQNASGYTLTFRDGSSENYDTSGKLLTMKDANNKTTIYAYDSNNRVASITGPFGHALGFTYNASGKLTQMTDPAGQQYGYTYGSNNNLTKATYPDGSAKHYHYENTSLPHQLTGISNDSGLGTVTRFSTYDYDASGKAISTEHAGGQGKVTLSYTSPTQTLVTDAANNTETLIFAENFGVKNLLSRINSDNKGINQTFDANNNRTCMKDAEGRVMTYIYNTANQRTSMTEGQTGDCIAPVATSATRTTTYAYVSNSIDLPTTITRPSVAANQSQTTTIAYDGNHNPTSITQSGFKPDGTTVANRSVTMGYNSQGQVTSINGPRTDVTDVTSFSYYSCSSGGNCGQIKTITNAIGHVTTFNSYDANGRVTEQTDANSTKTFYSYDLKGRVIAVTVQVGGSTTRQSSFTYTEFDAVKTATLPNGLTLTYSYNAAQELTQVSDSLGNQVDYAYDLRGNRIRTETIDPSSTIVRRIEQTHDLRNRVNSINSAGSITTLVNDAVGNLTQSTDPNQQGQGSPLSTTNSHDALNRITQTVDVLSGNTQYQYNTHNQVTQVTAPNSVTTSYSFDDLNNRLSETSPDRGTTAYAHNAAGQVTSITDARNITVTYSYDALGRVSKADYPGTSEDITYSYDSCVNGKTRLCGTTDQSGSAAYQYDAYGNTTRVTKVINGVTYVTQYAYDNRDQITTITYPDNRTVAYTRDTLSRITRVDTTVNGVTTVLANNMSYRADGLLTSQTFGNGLVENRAYDLQGRLQAQGSTVTPGTTGGGGTGGGGTTPAASVSIAITPASPQTVGNAVTFTATGTGGTGSYEYRFLINGPGTNNASTVIQDYSTINTWTWNTLPKDVGSSTITVQVRSAGSTAGYEASATTTYSVSTGVITPATGTTLTVSPASPQLAGSSIILTAQGTGGSGNYEYRFHRKGPDTGNAWVEVQAYSTSNTYTWTTTEAMNGTSTLGVHVRNVSSTVDSEAYKVDVLYIINTTYQPATGATLTADKASPQTAGTTITLTAQGSGGSVGSYEYRFHRKGPDTNNAWTMVQNYSTTNTYTWTTTEAMSGAHTFQVHVRNVGSTENPEVYSPYLTYTVNSSYQPATGATLTADKVSPQTAGTTVTITGQGSGGSVGSYEYKFYRKYGSTWTVVQNYSTTNTYTWNTTEAMVGTNTFQVWVRNVGSTASYEATSAYLVYTINSTYQPASGAALTADKASPQTAGTTITLTAQGSGGSVGSYEYRFYRNSGSWVVVQNYSSSNTYTWNATAGNHTFQVHIRNAGSTVGYETTSPYLTYTITSASAGLAPNGTVLAAGPRYILAGSPTSFYMMLPFTVSGFSAGDTRTYTYDANSNVTQRLTPQGTAGYTFDAADRLIQDSPIVGTGGSIGYDANANRTSDAAGSLSYQANSNRPITAHGATMTLDASGNLTNDGQGKTYSYNNQGRIYQVFDSGSLKATYTYNAQGQRVKKVTPSATTVYHYDLRGNLILETSATGTPQKAYVWRDSTPVAQIDKGTTETVSYLHTDHLNTPRFASNQAQTVVWTWESNAFGQTAANGDADGDGTTTTINLRFPGQYYDKESKLHYNWNRYYSPKLGRYITSDPVGLFAGNNTYTYVGNNPLVWSDPWGLDRLINPRPGGFFGPTITFNNDIPLGIGLSPDLPVSDATAEMIENAVIEAGVDININSTTGGIHGPRSRHPLGLACDINRVAGKPVNSKNIEAWLFQVILNKQPNIRENFGPFITTKTRSPIVVPLAPQVSSRPDQKAGHRTHIHASGQQ